MKKVFFALLIITMSPSLFAAVYKCVNGDHITFSESPCNGTTDKRNQYKINEGNVVKIKRLSQKKYIEKVKSKRTMSPLRAIKIKKSNCKQSHAGKVIYTGIIYNLSSYSTYSALIDIQYKFKLHKKDKDYLSWDKTAERFKLTPNKSYPFSISSSRILPSNSSVTCDSNLTVDFISAS